MDLSSFFDLAKLASVGALTLIIIQYIKEPIPEKLIKWVTLLVGILVSFFIEYKVGGALDVVVIVANGIVGAMGADGGYQFLSGTKSPAFSLPSQTQLVKKGGV